MTKITFKIRQIMTNIKKVLQRLKHKVDQAIYNKESLFCIGFHLHDFRLSDFSIGKEFAKPVYFVSSQFYGQADFSGATFQSGADFSHTTFHLSPSFCSATFQEKEANFSDIFSILINAPSLMW
jgi:hypothetical protein